jgi:high affinity Mn2+ porin
MLKATHNFLQTCRVLIMPAIVLLFSYSGTAQDTIVNKTPRMNLHFQTTYIYQYQPAFTSPYSGPNSLNSAEDKENSITATLNIGIRLWKGAEVYINPEVAGGSGLSGAFGLAASTNGETFRVGDPAPTLYIARGYFRQTFALSNNQQHIEDQANQLETNEPKNYLRFLIGKMSLGDVFDNNAYANSPRTQFMNWCLMNNGAWDYAANLRGYTYAFVGILQQGSMTYKAALAALPTVANGPDLNTNLNEEYSLNAEIDKIYTLGKGRKGTMRLQGYYNNGNMGNYALALQHPNPATGLPDVISTRLFERTKTGIGLNTDQQLTDNVGVFLRAGWNDGKNETWAFTEADRALAAGVNINGAAWKRKDDNLGLAIDVNGLSPDHRDYLGAGGLGFQLGDGKLSYANETAVELYYSFKPLSSGIWLSGDYQLILNPGYNSDRGPVNVFSLRVHVEL